MMFALRDFSGYINRPRRYGNGGRFLITGNRHCLLRVGRDGLSSLCHQGRRLRLMGVDAHRLGRQLRRSRCHLLNLVKRGQVRQIGHGRGCFSHI